MDQQTENNESSILITSIQELLQDVSLTIKEYNDTQINIISKLKKQNEKLNEEIKILKMNIYELQEQNYSTKKKWKFFF